MANEVFNQFKAKIMDGTIDLASNDIRIALLDSNHTTNIDTQHYWDEVNTNEVSGSGYNANGELLTGKSVSIDDTDDEGVFDASDVTWSSATISADYAVIFHSTSQASTSDLVCVYDFAGTKASTNGDFTLSFNSEGAVNLT